MTQDQLEAEIKANRLCYIVVTDWNDNKLAVINEKNSDRANKMLSDRLANFTGYKRLVILGKTDPKANTKDSFSYELEMKGAGSKADQMGLSPAGTIGAMEYVGMFKEMLGAQTKLQLELKEMEHKQTQQDPAKWLPVIQMITGYLQGTPVATQIQGPALTKGKVSNCDYDKLTDEQIGEKIGAEQAQLATKIKGSQYLQIVEALNSNPVIDKKVEEIITLLKGIASKPDLIDMAIKFV